MADWDAGTVPTAALFKGASFNYTPTITASTGTFTTVSASCRWTRGIGRKVTASFLVTITTAGTAAGTLFATLPVTGAPIGGGAAINEYGAGRETGSTGVMLMAWRVDTTKCGVLGYDSATRIANGRTYTWTLDYEAAE